MNGRRLLAGIILSLFITAVMGISGTGVLAAEEPRFILEIADPVMDVDSYTQMTITMINAKGAKVKELIGTDRFYMPYDGTSRTTKLYEGKMSYQETETYSVYPYYTGKFIIWALIEYDGKTYMTNKVELNITDDSTGGSGQPAKTFMNTTLTDNEVYIGQKTVLAYEVFSTYNFSSFFFLDDLQVNDILHTSAPEEMLKSGKAVQDGVEYKRNDVEISFLTPIKSGIFIIPGRDFYAYISEEDQTSEDEYSARAFSEPKELIVKPLPTENQPADFSWIIGKLEIDAKYDTLNAADDNTIMLTVTAFGECSLDSLNRIFREDPPGFSVYETVKRYTESFENNKYHAEKEFEIILAPKEIGTLTIAPVHISYFDPEAGSYKTVEIPGTTVTVDGDDKIMRTGGDQTGEDRTAGEQTDDGQTVVETVRIEQISYAPQNEGFWVLRISKTLVLILVIVLLVLGAAVFILLKRPIKRDEQLDDIYARLLKSKDENEVYNHFNSMIRYCFGISLKASSRREIAEGITDIRFVDPILEVVEYIEKEKFIPGKVDNELLKMIKEIYIMLKREKQLDV